MNSINILVEAKKEYTNQLQKILTPRLYEGFKSIYEDIINLLSRELEENKTQSSSIVKTFQKTLKEIPQWNQDMIKNEYNRIEKISNCDYFENLIEAIFITNTKILTSVQISDNKSKNIKINIPQCSHFIHKCYMECAKEIYKNPYIFDQSKILTPKEKHTNLRDALLLIDNSINNAIRDLLPIRDILLQGITKNNKQILNELTGDQSYEEENELKDEDENEENEENDDDDEENEYDANDENDTNNENEDDNKENENNIIQENKLKEETLFNNEDIKLVNVQENNNEIIYSQLTPNSNELSEKESNIIILENNEQELEEISKNIILDNTEKQIETKEIFLNKAFNFVPKKLEKVELIKDNNQLEKFNEIIASNIVLNTPKLQEAEVLIESNIIEIKENNNEILNKSIVENIQSNSEKNINFEVTRANDSNKVLSEQVIQKSATYEKMYDKKKTDIVKSNINNQFVKNFKNNKFMKTRFNGNIKNSSSFYKKKYEQNSANYNSISEKNDKDDISVLTDITENTNKVIKNKILIDGGNSSDEEDNEDIIDLGN
jgi:hypothetical protein